MDRFSDLPLELFQSLLLLYLTKKELSILSRTSTHLRTAIEPILYREIRWKWQKDTPQQPPIHLLVRTVMSRPRLAMFIEHLDLGGIKPRTAWKTCPYRPRSYLPAGPSTSIYDTESLSSFSHKEMNAIEESSLWSCLTSKDLWLQELRRGEVDIFVAVLLSQLPSLKRLTLGSDFQRDTPFIGEIISSSNSGSTPKQLFPALESVTYSNDIVQDLDVAYHFVHLNQVLPLFYMGSLRSLSISLPPLAITWPQDEIPKSHLTSLVLSHSQLSEENLGHLLMATPRLRSLEYHSHFDIDSGGRPGRTHLDYYDCNRLDESLAHVKESLERLVLSVRFSSLQSDVALGGFQGMNHKVQSLQHFKKLQDCVIPFIMLLGWDYDAKIAIGDLLPSNLEKICFTDDLDIFGACEWTDEGFLELIRSYLERRGPCELKLKSVSLELNTSQTSWCEGERSRLSDACNNAEVDCAIIKRKPDLPRRGLYPRLPYKSRVRGSSRGFARGR